MGIRFYCTECGRKLNIKAFLAGKRGICPHCDARVQIPFESQIPDDAPKYRPVLDGNPTVAQVATPVMTQEGSSDDGDRDFIAEEQPAPQPVTDPIAEAPEAVWYVRPPSGGQYGPARGDVMRRWVAEGRVSSDSMVWREGWADWQTAGPLFPTLGESAVASEPTSSVSRTSQTAASFVASEGVARSATATMTASIGRKKSIVPLIGLGLLIVVLLVVTVIVVTQTGS